MVLKVNWYQKSILNMLQNERNAQKDKNLEDNKFINLKGTNWELRNYCAIAISKHTLFPDDNKNSFNQF
jgi:hypothetical protein